MIVEIYTKPRCIQCDATKRWLAARGIPFVEKAAEDYADFLQVRLHHQSAPVVILYLASGEHVTDWSGYRSDLLASYLGDFPTQEAA